MQQRIVHQACLDGAQNARLVVGIQTGHNHFDAELADARRQQP